MPKIDISTCANEILRGVNSSKYLEGSWKSTLFGFRPDEGEPGASTRYEVSVYQRIDEGALSTLLSDRTVAQHGAVVIQAEMVFQAIEAVDKGCGQFWFDHDPIVKNGVVVNKYHSDIVASLESTEARRTLLSKLIANWCQCYMEESHQKVMQLPQKN